MRTLLVLGLLLTAAVANGGDANNNDLAKLQGKWTAKISDPKLGDGKVELTFANNTFALRLMNSDGKDFVLKGTFTLNAAKKPAHMDFKFPDRTEKDDFAKGIYELKGDTLRWCIGGRGTPERPEGFPNDEGGAGYLNFTLQRVK